MQHRLSDHVQFLSSDFQGRRYRSQLGSPHPFPPTVNFLPTYIVKWGEADFYQLFRVHVGGRTEVVSVTEAAARYAKEICRTAFMASPWPGHGTLRGGGTGFGPSLAGTLGGREMHPSASATEERRRYSFLSTEMEAERVVNLLEFSSFLFRIRRTDSSNLTIGGMFFGGTALDQVWG